MDVELLFKGLVYPEENACDNRLVDAEKMAIALGDYHEVQTWQSALICRLRMKDRLTVTETVNDMAYI